MDRRVSELELRALSDMKQVVGQALNLGQALQSTLNILSQHLSTKRAAITVKKLETGRLLVKASSGLRAEERKRGFFRLEEAVAGHLFRSTQAFVMSAGRDEPWLADDVVSGQIEKQQISFIGVPIVLQGNPLGIFFVDRLFGEGISLKEDLSFLRILADWVAQLIGVNYQVKTKERRLDRASASLKRDFLEKYNDFFSEGRSASILEVQELVRKVAPTRASVMLLGESGTGKTLVARIIHELSGRAAGPFVKLNCAGFSENLIESELFGHERGAFEGALEAKAGRVEEADGGSIFLNEIGELALPAQAKLLMLIQDKEFERLGATRTRKVDVRVLAGCNQDLARAVGEGLFRQDLYYRLNIFPIRLAPLRDRREDIPSLLDFFTERLSREAGSSLRFTDQAMEALNKHSWPGNIREMENLMERLAFTFGTHVVDVADVAPHISRRHVELENYHVEELNSLREMERRGILAALERHNWVQSRAARELGITLRQMGYRVKKFQLEDLVKQRRSDA